MDNKCCKKYGTTHLCPNQGYDFEVPEYGTECGVEQEHNCCIKNERDLRDSFDKDYHWYLTGGWIEGGGKIRVVWEKRKKQ